MRGGNEGEALYRRPDPVARGEGGDRPPGRPQEGRPAPLAPVGQAHWLVARGVGDRGLSPVGGGDRPPLFFSSDFVANLKEKNYI